MLNDLSNKLQRLKIETFYCYPYGTIILSFVLSILISFLWFKDLRIDNNLYYSVLSSIFQGIFSILALAGLFIIFKTEQLSNDISKYTNYINDDLSKLSKSKLNYINGSLLKQDKDDKILAIQELLSKDKKGTEENLKKKNDELEYRIEEHLNQIPKTEENLAEMKQFMLIFNHYLTNVTLRSKSKSLKSDLIKFFKLPLIHGMLMIILAIYFLPLIDWKSNLSWHTPITIIIGTAIILTIIVVLEIFYLINKAMWGEEIDR